MNDENRAGLACIADSLQYVLDEQERTDGALTDEHLSSRVWPETPTRGVLKRWIATIRSAAQLAPCPSCGMVGRHYDDCEIGMGVL